MLTGLNNPQRETRKTTGKKKKKKKKKKKPEINSHNMLVVVVAVVVTSTQQQYRQIKAKSQQQGRLFRRSEVAEYRKKAHGHVTINHLSLI